MKIAQKHITGKKRDWRNDLESRSKYKIIQEKCSLKRLIFRIMTELWRNRQRKKWRENNLETHCPPKVIAASIWNAEPNLTMSRKIELHKRLSLHVCHIRKRAKKESNLHNAHCQIIKYYN